MLVVAILISYTLEAFCFSLGEHFFKSMSLSDRVENQ